MFAIRKDNSMMEVYYQVMYLSNGQWRTFGGDERPVKAFNPYNAKAIRDEVNNIPGHSDAMVVKVTKAPFQDVVTRQLYVQTTYQAIGLNDE